MKVVLEIVWARRDKYRSPHMEVAPHFSFAVARSQSVKGSHTEHTCALGLA